jgi:pimeloyl-ACP methyl ester carboxylesterase
MAAALVLFAVVVATLAAGLIWQSIEERRDLRRFPPAGRMLEGVHIHCTGEGQPPVVLESGIAASSVGWALVQPELSRFTKVCATDRPGLAWSELSREGRTPDQFMREMRAVIRFAGTPVILVGHSFGALLVRLYASRFPGDVAGLVLADPALLCEWANPTETRKRMLARGVRLSRRGASLARIGFVRLSLALLTGGRRFLPKLFATMSSGKGASVTERLVGEVRKLPPELWPVVQSHWCRPRSFRSMAEHLESLPAVAAEVARSPLPQDLPVIVISGGHLSTEQLREHQEIAQASKHGRHILAEGSGHWIHLDRPDLIVEAVRSLLSKHG